MKIVKLYCQITNEQSVCFFFFKEYDNKIVPYNIKTYKCIYIVRNKYFF